MSSLDVRLIHASGTDDACNCKDGIEAEMPADLDVQKKLESFDPRNARCFTEQDTLHLHGVVQLAGYDCIADLVRKVFLERHPRSFLSREGTW